MNLLPPDKRGELEIAATQVDKCYMISIFTFLYLKVFVILENHLAVYLL